MGQGGDENTIFSLVFSSQFLCNTISTWQRISCY